MTSIGWHILLVIEYFVWYFFQRRYNAKHFKDDPPNPRDSIASGLQLGVLDPRPSRPSDEVPLSPLQVSFSSQFHMTPGASEPRSRIRQRDSDLFTDPSQISGYHLLHCYQARFQLPQKSSLNQNNIRKSSLHLYLVLCVVLLVSQRREGAPSPPVRNSLAAPVQRFVCYVAFAKRVLELHQPLYHLSSYSHPLAIQVF
jgi:hypothetical protein